MNKEELVKLIEKKPYIKTMGKGLISSRYHCSIEDVLWAKKNATIVNRNEKPSLKLPKILIFDIETAPMKAYVWKRWKENISLDQTISDWFMICWSAKWLYDADVMGDVLTPEEIKNENDSRIVKSIWKLIDEADIIVAYNGLNFDIPRLNTRFIINGLQPPTTCNVVDPILIAKKQFAFSSNKMDNIATQLGLTNKLDTDFNLWKSCMEGNEEALGYMLSYNKQDVNTLEEIYIKMLPWIKNHPNVQNYVQSSIPVCSHCGSTDINLIPDKFYYTGVSRFNLYRCECCGAVVRGRNNINFKEHVSVPIISCSK